MFSIIILELLFYRVILHCIVVLVEINAFQYELLVIICINMYIYFVILLLFKFLLLFSQR